jgi:predicted DNA-binding ribbon-helix-helix protein
LRIPALSKLRGILRCFYEKISERKSTLINRNITVLVKRTSVRLAPVKWDSLKAMAHREECAIHDICSLIHLRKKSNTFLTAAIRVFIVLYYRAAVTEEGHAKAGHGDFSTMIHRARVRLKPAQNPPHNLTKGGV